MLKTLDSKTDLGVRIAEEMNRHGSDKQSAHNYSEGYAYFIEKLLPSDPKTFLEIGISNRGPEESSLHGWASVFPTTSIYGIDIAPRKMIDTDRITTFIVDQSDPFQLSSFRRDCGTETFDIILDDGSHVMDHAKLSFDVLFKMIPTNGLYMIEDVSKIDGMWEQSVSEWDNYLSLRSDVQYEIIDCQPENAGDDSVLIGIWRKDGD